MDIFLSGDHPVPVCLKPPWVLHSLTHTNQPTPRHTWPTTALTPCPELPSHPTTFHHKPDQTRLGGTWRSCGASRQFQCIRGLTEIGTTAESPPPPRKSPDSPSSSPNTKLLSPPPPAPKKPRGVPNTLTHIQTKPNQSSTHTHSHSHTHKPNQSSTHTPGTCQQCSTVSLALTKKKVTYF